MDKYKVIVLLALLLLVLLSTYVIAQGGRTTRIDYPKGSDILSQDDDVRGLAIGKLLKTQRGLVNNLSHIVHKDNYKKFSVRMRTNACYLLGELRPASPEAVKALISVADKDADFELSFSETIKDIPSQTTYPANALARIGHPGYPYILDAIAETDSKRRWAPLCASLTPRAESAQDFRFACSLVQERIAAETDQKKKNRLRAALEYYKKIWQETYGGEQKGEK